MKSTDDKHPRVRGVQPVVQQAAETLRNELTPAEKTLWQSIRNRKLAGMKFRRQHPLGRFILDFCCVEKKLVIELDGEIHEQQKEYDEERSKVLEQYGYRVIRFSNDEVMVDLHGVLARIVTVVGDR